MTADPDVERVETSRRAHRPPSSAATPPPLPEGDRLSLRYELVRKSIHFATVALPVAVWFLPRPWSLTLLAVGVVAALTVEWARTRIRWARYAFLTRTRRLLRRHERKRFAGATYMAIAYLLAYLIFPRPIAVAAMLFGGLGDATAALAGKRWGRHRTPWGKSWEGAAAGFAVSFAAAAVIPGITPAAAVAGAAIAALVELAPIPIDDNLLVTLAGGTALWAAAALL